MKHVHGVFRLPVRSALSVLLTFVLTFATQAQETNNRSRRVSLKRGQVLQLSLSSEIDSGRTKLGDDVLLKLAAPLTTDGEIILPIGWTVRGIVTGVKHAGKNCRNGDVTWRLLPIDTPADEKILVQRIDSYDRSSVPGEPEWVHLDTPLKKVGHGIEFAGATVAVIALSPIMVPIAIFMTERCHGEAGRGEIYPLETHFLAAISKTVRVTVPPDQPRVPIPAQ